jgi:hypothetical protein
LTAASKHFLLVKAVSEDDGAARLESDLQQGCDCLPCNLSALVVRTANSHCETRRLLVSAEPRPQMYVPSLWPEKGGWVHLSAVLSGAGVTS